MECGEGEKWLLKPDCPGLPGIRIVEDPSKFSIEKIEEIFTPILTVMQIGGGIEEAVAAANRVRGSLTAALYSRKPPHIQHFKEQIQTGNPYILRGSTGAPADLGFGDGAGTDSHRGAHGGKTG